MHFQETDDIELLLEKAKSILFSKMPYTIKVFDEDDATYFIFAEFADYIIENINLSEEIKKTVLIIDELIALKEEVIDNLVILQVFQKIYPKKDIMSKYHELLSDETQAVFDKYFFEFNKRIE